MNNAVKQALEITGLYSEAELERLCSYVESLPRRATVVEIGVLYGRTASILFEISKEKQFNIYLIDPWVVLEDHTFPSFHDTYYRRFFRIPFVMVNAGSAQAEHLINPAPHLVHIDGYHMPEGVEMDCRIWCPRLLSQGIVVFHDYDLKDDKGGLQYPGIQAAAAKWCKGWEPLGIVETQAAFRKP